MSRSRAPRAPAREAVVLVNRRARWLAAPGPVLDAVTRRRPGIEVVETTSQTELDRAARALAEAPPRVVVLAGGDGTYGTSATALERAFTAVGAAVPALALAPAGTTCTVARNWSWRGGGVVTAGSSSAARACARVLDAVAAGAGASGSPVPAPLRPSLRVSPEGAAARLGFIVGAGLVARFFELYEEAGARGYRSAAAIVARIFAGSLVGGALASRVLEPLPCEVEVDGVRAPFERVSLVVASVVRDLGLSMRLAHRAGALDRFHAIATPLGPRGLGAQMPLVLAARPLLGPRVDALARDLSLRFPAGEGAFVVDGDLVRGDAVRVTAGPTFRVLALDRR